MTDPLTTGPLTTDAGSYSVRERAEAGVVSGCFVELHADGTVVLVVDGERLFHFDSFEALLAQYELVRGDLRAGSVGEARTELAAAEVAAGVAVAAILTRPRAEKALVDDRVARAIDRVRLARERLASFQPTD